MIYVIIPMVLLGFQQSSFIRDDKRRRPNDTVPKKRAGTAMILPESGYSAITQKNDIPPKTKCAIAYFCKPVSLKIACLYS